MLHAAVLGAFDIVYVLLEAGADPVVKNKWGESLLNIIKGQRVPDGHKMKGWQNKVIAMLEK